MERAILHVDCNKFYASVECLHRPEIRNLPVIVGGDAELRHGIVLTKNEIASKYNIKTGEAIWQAKQKCPGLVVVKPNFQLYVRFSKMARDIYGDYTDQIEPFGLDECWIDVTGSGAFGDGTAIAEEIRKRVKFELGITVSIGVSYNKIFAKLGSDYKKPDAVTVIDREHFRGMVWPLPASDLLMVGRSTSAGLRRMGIYTIGDLARTEPELLSGRFGKAGAMLYAFANGLDTSPVRRTGDEPEAKSVGSSTTAARDITCDAEARLVLLTLAESVGARLRESGFMCRMVEVSIRSAENLGWRSHRMRLRYATDLTDEILEAACALYRECRADGEILRSVGIRAAELVRADGPEQTDLFCDYVNRNKKSRLDRAMDGIRGKYGFDSIRRACTLADWQLGGLDARKDGHAVHPAGFYV